jgi:hypothetical protein
LFCSFFLKIGMPAAVLLFDYNFVKVIATTVSGGIFGVVVFTYLSDALIKWWNRYRLRRFNKKYKSFSKSNRRIIRVKSRFGLMGIALVSPILLSIPVGAFLCDKFYKNKKKVMLYLSVSVIFWDILLYFIFYFFHDSLQWLF